MPYLSYTPAFVFEERRTLLNQFLDFVPTQWNHLSWQQRVKMMAEFEPARNQSVVLNIVCTRLLSAIHSIATTALSEHNNSPERGADKVEGFKKLVAADSLSVIANLLSSKSLDDVTLCHIAVSFETAITPSLNFPKLINWTSLFDNKQRDAVINFLIDLSQ